MMARILGVLVPWMAIAQGPLPVEKESHHKVFFKNDDLRILEVNVAEGMETLDHQHANDIVTVCMECADTRTRSPGEPWSDIRNRKVGGALIAEYSGKPAVHAVRNVGAGSYRLFAVENLRQKAWSVGIKLTAPATTLAEEGRSFRIYDVGLGGNSTTTAHIHTVPTVVLLLKGPALASGGGKTTTLKQPGQWEIISPSQSHVLSVEGREAAKLVEIEVR
jgi:hypothetical protein